MTTNQHPLVLFDGVCNLCNGVVQFIIKKDKAGRFRFAPLQTKTGQEILQQNGLDTQDLQTFLLVENGVVHKRSTAALHLFKILGGWWRLLYLFIIIPRPLRDAIYNWVARNRYSWFGQQESCMIPTPELQSRFLKD